MLQASSVSTQSLFDRLRAGAGRRTLAIGLALLIEVLLLLLLLSLGADKQPGKGKDGLTVVDLRASEALEQAEAPSESQAEDRPLPDQPAREESQPEPIPEPAPSQPPEPEVTPTVRPVLPPEIRPPSIELPRNAAPPASAPKAVYGPPNKGGSAAFRDSERVGTAPNGEPLYAAAWYREPRPDQLRDYLSTASGPGWGLIACRTAPDYRVEDCVGIDEYPQGSQIVRAILAAAWEFKVRPPRLGGKSLVGSWVQIRIDYGIEQRR